jgi:hypothetical protein
MAISGQALDPSATGGAADPAEELLRRAEAGLVAARRAGRERLAVAADWARLHAHGADAHPLDHWTEIGASRLRVYEYAAAELAVSLQVHPLAAHRLMGDAIDLQGRLPQTWEAVHKLRVDDWVARRIASKTRDLSDDQARVVDAQIADLIGTLPPGRLFALVDARVAEADLAAAEARAERARTEHGVWAQRPDSAAPDTAGLFIRGGAADLTRFGASVDHLAGLLAEAAGEGEAETFGQLRARAVGILADPQGAVDFLAGRNPARGRTTLYVHTTLDQLTAPGHGSGVARVEEIGPFARTQLVRLLGHEQITVKPVLDLADSAPVDCYEVPAAMAEQLHLIKPADVFPHATSVSRRQDHDHTVAYDADGPPGQTRLDNLGHLSRRHHRVKTHARDWSLAQLPGNRYLWITPHGRYRITDSTGTHVIPVSLSELLLAA